MELPLGGGASIIIGSTPPSPDHTPRGGEKKFDKITVLDSNGNLAAGLACASNPLCACVVLA